MQSTEAKKSNLLQRGWLILIAGLAVIIGIGANLLLIKSGDNNRQELPLQINSGTLIPNPRPLTPFNLTDHNGKTFSQDSIKGQWHLLSFGYTNCPDICPTTLAMLAQLDDQMNQYKTDPEIKTAFITIDPERDTQQKLSSYVPYFNNTFLGITGSLDELEKLTRQLGVLYARVETKESSLDYLMDHSTSIILINPEGEFQAVFSSPHVVKAMTEDLIRITTR